MYRDRIGDIGYIGCIVEIGVDFGFSFFTFARDFPEARVVGIDNFSYNTGIRQREHLNEHLGTFPNAIVFEMESGEARKAWNDPNLYLDIDILHIDADHKYESVKRDFELWESVVRPGGVVLFHDIVAFKDDVGRFFDELEGKKDRIEEGAGLGIWWKDE
tara:strand:+ start:2357 stop:2836 length:480 start_codon:yes stop_codon:yes gene_type:complete